MAPLPRWFDKARATGARLISYEPHDATRSSRLHQCMRGRGAVPDYSDIPPFLLPLSVRVRLDRDRRKTRSRPSSRPASYDNNTTLAQKRKRKLKMPTVLKRLAGPRTCPIVVAQYKDEYRGVGHEEDLHWALVVITDRHTLSGPSFQAYAQKKRRRRTSRALASTANGQGTPRHSSYRSKTGRGAGVSRGGNSTLRSADHKDPLLLERQHEHEREREREHEARYEVQWYARHAPASLFDVCATVRTLCLGGVQVGSVRAADVGKLIEYLQSHPPTPSHATWSSRDYVLELLELLRPFKMLRPDLQSLHLRAPAGARREVGVEDLLPELREVGRVTQESIFNEDFRPCVKYHS